MPESVSPSLALSSPDGHLVHVGSRAMVYHRPICTAMQSWFLYTWAVRALSRSPVTHSQLTVVIALRLAPRVVFAAHERARACCCVDVVVRGEADSGYGSGRACT